MITYASLKSAILSRLDAEGTDRYLDAQDIIPATNAAVGRVLAACNYAFAQRKGSEKILSELLLTRVFQSNAEGGVYMDAAQLGHGVWDIEAVYCQPSVFGAQSTAPIPNAQAASLYRSDLTFTGSEYPARRITIEQLALTTRNKFMQGNEALANTPWLSYAYAILGDRRTSAAPVTPTVPWSAGGWELVVVPKSKMNKQLVAISYFKEPTVITTPADSIELPQTAFNILVDWALQYISVKQGDGTTLYTTSDKDAAQLFNMQS